MQYPNILRRLKEMKVIKETGHSSEYWRGYIEGINDFAHTSKKTLELNRKHITKLVKEYSKTMRGRKECQR